jgi:predicted RNA-binding Zn ribbon-like protein
MSESRPAAMFVADAPALDFLNSIASSSGTPVEWLDSGENLLDWVQGAQLAPPEVLGQLRRAGVPGELDAVAAQARALREWFRGFVMEHKGRRLRAEALKDLAPLNRILERDLEYGQIVKRERGQDLQTGSALAWKPLRRWQTPDSLLFPIARSMAELVSHDDFTYVRACEGPNCTLLFLDRTHGRVRRWCSMAVCGNRAKQAAHRQRERRTAR